MDRGALSVRIHATYDTRARLNWLGVLDERADAVLYWHVDDIEAMFKRPLAQGASMSPLRSAKSAS